MKRMEVAEKQIGENVYYIRPFGAFVAANISGELVAVLSPFIGGLVAISGASGNGEGSSVAAANGGATVENATDLLNMNVEDVVPVLADAFSSLSGDKFESIIKRLLVDQKNISVEGEDTDGEVKLLTRDLADEVFCGELQDMFVLCWEVIKLNYKGFFGKLKTRSGGQKGSTETTKK